MKIKFLGMIVLGIFTCIYSLNGAADALPEAVLQPGARITSHLKDGTEYSFSATGFKRKVSISGCQFEIELSPRTKRWFGSMGLIGQGEISWIKNT